MSEAIQGLADRVTASTPRGAASSHPLVLQFAGGALPLQSAVSVGADASNQVVLDDRFVSRFHCRLVPVRGRWLVEDLDSTNGTYLDGARVSAAEIDAGARVRVGAQELRIERSGPPLRASLPGLVARDPALTPVLDLLRRAAPSDLPVTILGESGTGKEIAARAVHELSHRNAGPFVPVNCGAISRELAEAELFGHERGAFTGAITSAPGAFGAADGGTLFLDEIGDMPPALQGKILRLLQEQSFERVGSNETIRADVRLIAATHRDLKTLSAEGKFRADLYYRLGVFTIHLPPLRERAEDLPLLVQHFLRCFSRELGRAVEHVAPEALEQLRRYPWPGNIRELQSILKQALLKASGVVLLPAFLPEPVTAATEPSPTTSAPAFGFDAVLPQRLGPDVRDLYTETHRQVDRLLLPRVLEYTRGSQHQAALLLGIARQTLRLKLRELGLSPRRIVEVEGEPG